MVVVWKLIFFLGLFALSFVSLFIRVLEVYGGVRTIGGFNNISLSLSLTSPVVQLFEDELYTATACPDDKSSSSLLSGGTTSRLCRFHPTFQVSLEGYLLLCQLQSLAAWDLVMQVPLR